MTVTMVTGLEPVDFPALVFLDVDGVLADTRHREHFVECDPPQWGAFFAEMVFDDVHEPGQALYGRCMASGAQIVYLTGRNEHYRLETSAWLYEHEFSLEWDLVMRPAGFKWPLALWKREVLKMAAGQINTSHVQPWWQYGYPRDGGLGSAVTDKDIVIVDDDFHVAATCQSAGFAAIQPVWQPKNLRLINTTRG